MSQGTENLYLNWVNFFKAFLFLLCQIVKHSSYSNIAHNLHSLLLWFRSPVILFSVLWKREFRKAEKTPADSSGSEREY